MSDLPAEPPPSDQPETDGYAPAARFPAEPNSHVVRASHHPSLSPAEWAYERLTRQIAAFEAKLTDGEEVGGKVTNAPGDLIFQIEDLGWWGPDMIMFYGRNGEGRPVQLMQHYTQLNVLLSAMKKAHDEPAKRIGFALARRLREKAPVNQLDAGRTPRDADNAA